MSNMKILIVDDNTMMRRSIRDIVAAANDSIIECINGSSVLTEYSKMQPDFVLMDIDMPVKNGLEATKELRTKYPLARVIILTNYNDDDLREEAKEAGAEKYFTKDNLIEVKNYLHSAAK